MLVTCPHCSQTLNIPDQYQGQSGTCRNCSRTFVANGTPNARPGAPPVQTVSSQYVPVLEKLEHVDRAAGAFVVPLRKMSSAYHQLPLHKSPEFEERIRHLTAWWRRKVPHCACRSEEDFTPRLMGALKNRLDPLLNPEEKPKMLISNDREGIEGGKSTQLLLVTDQTLYVWESVNRKAAVHCVPLQSIGAVHLGTVKRRNLAVIQYFSGVASFGFDLTPMGDNANDAAMLLREISLLFEAENTAVMLLPGTVQSKEIPAVCCGCLSTNINPELAWFLHDHEQNVRNSYMRPVSELISRKRLRTNEISDERRRAMFIGGLLGGFVGAVAAGAIVGAKEKPKDENAVENDALSAFHACDACMSKHALGTSLSGDCFREHAQILRFLGHRPPHLLYVAQNGAFAQHCVQSLNARGK